MLPKFVLIYAIVQMIRTFYLLCYFNCANMFCIIFLFINSSTFGLRWLGSGKRRATNTSTHWSRRWCCPYRLGIKVWEMKSGGVFFFFISMSLKAIVEFRLCFTFSFYFYPMRKLLSLPFWKWIFLVPQLWFRVFGCFWHDILKLFFFFLPFFFSLNCYPNQIQYRGLNL